MPAFEPYVRYAKKTTYFIGGKNLITRDCHLLYVISGKGSFTIGGKSVSLTPSSLVYYPYGLPYRIGEESDMLFYTVNFDFCPGGEEIPPMVPQTAENYKNPIESLSSAPSSLFGRELLFPAAGWAENAMRTVCGEARDRMPYHAQIGSAFLKALLYEMLRHAGESDHPLCRQIKAAAAENPLLNNGGLARLLGYHPYYLGQIFRENEGITLHRYLLTQRLILAYDRITSTKRPMEEIASECGFSSPAHLSSSFKAVYGFSPGLLRKQG